MNTISIALGALQLLFVGLVVVDQWARWHRGEKRDGGWVMLLFVVTVILASALVLIAGGTP